MQYPSHQHASFAEESSQESCLKRIPARDAEYAPAIPSPTLIECDHVEELSTVVVAVQSLQVLQHCNTGLTPKQQDPKRVGVPDAANCLQIEREELSAAMAGANEPTSLEGSKAAVAEQSQQVLQHFLLALVEELMGSAPME